MYLRKTIHIFALTLIFASHFFLQPSAGVASDNSGGLQLSSQNHLPAANDTEAPDPKTQQLIDLYKKLENAENNLEALEKKQSEAKKSKLPGDRKWLKSKSKNELKKANKNIKDISNEIKKFEKNNLEAKYRYEKIKENELKEDSEDEQKEDDDKIKKRSVRKDKRIKDEVIRRKKEKEKEEAEAKKKTEP